VTAAGLPLPWALQRRGFLPGEFPDLRKSKKRAKIEQASVGLRCWQGLERGPGAGPECSRRVPACGGRNRHIVTRLFVTGFLSGWGTKESHCAVATPGLGVSPATCCRWRPACPCGPASITAVLGRVSRAGGRCFPPEAPVQPVSPRCRSLVHAPPPPPVRFHRGFALLFL